MTRLIIILFMIGNILGCSELKRINGNNYSNDLKLSVYQKNESDLILEIVNKSKKTVMIASELGCDGNLINIYSPSGDFLFGTGDHNCGGRVQLKYKESYIIEFPLFDALFDHYKIKVTGNYRCVWKQEKETYTHYETTFMYYYDFDKMKKKYDL